MADKELVVPPSEMTKAEILCGVPECGGSVTLNLNYELEESSKCPVCQKPIISGMISLMDVWRRRARTKTIAQPGAGHITTQRKAVASRLRPGTLADLPDDVHFPGGILANANWLVPISEFPPAPVPINHGYKTGEGGRNRLRVAVLHPDTEPRLMFSFIDAGGWFAHFIRPLGPVPAPKVRRLPLAETIPQLWMDDEFHDAAFTSAKGHEALAPFPRRTIRKTERTLFGSRCCRCHRLIAARRRLFQNLYSFSGCDELRSLGCL